jgi:small-conductance mechanosensitive channel
VSGSGLHVVLAVGEIAVALMLIALFAALAARFRRWLMTRFTARGRGVVVRGVELVSVAVVERTLRVLSAVIGLVFVAAVAYGAVLLFLWRIGAPQGTIDRLTLPVRDALLGAGSDVVGYVPQAVLLALIVVIARVAASALRALMEAIAKRRLTLLGVDHEVARPTERIGVLLIWVVAVVMAVPYLPGSSSKAFQGITIVLGVVVSLGSSSVVGNLLSGLTIVYSREFSEGDRVRIGEVYGDVMSLGAFATKIRTIAGEEVTLPNTFVQSVPVTNYSGHVGEGRNGLRVKANVTIGYDAPWRQVHDLLENAARVTHGVADEPDAYVLQRALNDFYVSYELHAYCNCPGELQHVESRLHQNIQDLFAQAGVEICSPHYYALRDGNRAAVPDKHQGTFPRGGFRVERSTHRPSPDDD